MIVVRLIQTTVRTPVLTRRGLYQALCMTITRGDELAYYEQRGIMPPSAVSSEQAVGARAFGDGRFYRFDGVEGDFSFSADVGALVGSVAPGPDPAHAQMRLAGWMSAGMPGLRTFAAVTVGDVAGNLPARQGPYGAQPDVARPLAGMMTPGQIDGNGQFFIPRFSSTSGLMSAHTPGSEPGDGTLVTTKATITPSTKSGKLVIDREIFDQGGSPQIDQVLGGLFQQAYDDVMDAIAAAYLDSLSLSTTTLAGVDDVLVADLRATAATWRFSRGSALWSALAMNADLYGALVAAVDDSHRPLIGVDPAGVLDTSPAGVPAPALGSFSYAWRPENLYLWSSPLRMLTFSNVNVSSVKVGVMQYGACAALVPTDVARIEYDESV